MLFVKEGVRFEVMHTEMDLFRLPEEARALLCYCEEA